MKLQKFPTNYNVLSANIGFPPGYSTNVGSQIKASDVKKAPMLITASKRFISEHVDFDMEDQYVFYILFYPTNETVWKTGVFAAHKKDTACFYSCWSLDSNPKQSIIKCFKALRSIVDTNKESVANTLNDVKMGIWVNNWLIKMPTISLQEVLQLEEYKEEKKVISG